MTSQSAERIGGWLLAPLAWLLVALLSASLSLLFFANALMSPQTYTLLRAMSAGHMALWVASLLFARHVVLHALADYRLFQAALGGAETLYYLAAHHPAAGDKGFCLLAGLGCACPASAAVSAAGRCAAGALFSPFAAGKTDFC